MPASTIVLILTVSGALAAPPTTSPLRLVHTTEAPTAEPRPTGAPTDTLYLLGGPGRLDGKFEDGAGVPDRQGWTGVDLTQPADVWWSISTFNAGPLDPTTPGNRAWWCGRLFAPCSPEDPPEGTGDEWDERLDWSGVVPAPAAPVTVRVRARISYDTDPANDWLLLQAWQGSAWSTLEDWTARGTAVAVDETIVLDPADYTGTGGDEVRLRWRFISDGAFSDEDCLWPGTGVQIDSVAVTFDQGGGEHLVGTVETCEPGDPLQWTPTGRIGVGEFSAVRGGLGDLDPLRDNSSPQFTFIDDGMVVPGTGGQPCLTWCYGPGGWIVNQDRGLADTYVYLDDEVRSPPLAVPAGDRPGALLAFDVYVHGGFSSTMRTIAALWHVRSTADPAGQDGWSEWRDRGTALWGGPAYVRVHHEVSDLLVPDAAWIQVALGARDLGYGSGDDGTPAPYFDNVAFKVFVRAEPQVHLVRPDGLGDYATIQEAIGAAAVGDTVRLADGVFTGPGNRSLDFLGKDLVLASAGGDPAACVIDCEGSAAEPRRVLRFASGEGPDAVVMGVTLRGGWENVNGGAVLISGASPTFRDCVFTDNIVGANNRNGGAVSIRGGAPSFLGCTFTRNEAYYGGAVTAYEGARPLFEDCLFALNVANRGGGGIHAAGSGSDVTIRRCTFADHTSRIFGGAVALFSQASADLGHSIIAFAAAGPAIYLDTAGGATAALACCDLYGNPGGNWTGALAPQLGQDGNLEADPRFCRTWGGGDPYALMDTSPCAPDHAPGCGLMGARAVACSDPSPVPDDLPAAPGPALSAWPNPFNPVTTLAYVVPAAGRVELRIHDLRNRLVRTLVAGSEDAGTRTVVWRGDDDAGHAVASGVYLAVLTTAGGRTAAKLALIR